MKRLVSSMSGNQKGFTLIELLVVIAILGVIAAVVALNVAGFFGRGTQQAANTEAHQIQTAVIAYMADNPGANVTASIGPVTNYPVGYLTGAGVWKYLMNPAMLQATYAVADGAVFNATLITNSQWTGCTFLNGLWTCGS